MIDENRFKPKFFETIFSILLQKAEHQEQVFLWAAVDKSSSFVCIKQNFRLQFYMYYTVHGQKM